MADTAEMFTRFKISCMMDDLGYGDIFKYCDDTFGRDDFKIKASMVVGYEKIKDRFPGTIYIDNSVKEYIDKVVKPYTDKGFEVPYFLLGTYSEAENGLTLSINKVIDFSNKSNLKQDMVAYTSESIEKLESELSSGIYNVAVIGHSHPVITYNISDYECNEKILYQHIKPLKNELGFRGDNLDLSVMDVKAFITFADIIKPINEKAIVMWATYHHNGEFNLLFHNGEYGLSLATDVYHVLEDGSLEPINNVEKNKIDKVR